MRRFFIALAAMAALGCLGGWLSAGGGVSGFRNSDASWSLPELPPLGESERLKLFTSLMATNHFGIERDSARSNEADNEGAARAPRIAAAWIKNGRITLSFDNDDGNLTTAGIGDALPGGWIIKDATLDHVTVEREGEIIEIKVFPYDNPGI